MQGAGSGAKLARMREAKKPVLGPQLKKGGWVMGGLLEGLLEEERSPEPGIGLAEWEGEIDELRFLKWEF